MFRNGDKNQMSGVNDTEYRVKIYKGDVVLFDLHGVDWQMLNVLVFLVGAAGFEYQAYKE